MSEMEMNVKITARPQIAQDGRYARVHSSSTPCQVNNNIISIANSDLFPTATANIRVSLTTNDSLIERRFR
jgi:hypothetical protein